LSGIKSVGLGMTVPLRGGSGGLRDVRVENHTDAPGMSAPQGALRTADAGYFAAAGIALVKGRVFEGSDDQSAPPVAIINRSLAKRLFGDQDPVGEYIAFAPIPGR